jgi:hypothetical protein
MRAEVALLVVTMLIAPNGSWDGLLIQQQADQGEGDKHAGSSAPSTETKPAESQNAKPIAACGFCLEDGTKVPLTLGRELSSGKESTGNRVDFEVSEDIKLKDVLVIPKGSLAMGTITEAQERRRLGRAGKLNVRIEQVRLADGSRAKLRAVQESKGKGRQGLMTAAIIGAGILFFPAAPVFLFMRGKDVVIAKGTPVVSYVDGDTELDKAKFEVAAKPGEPSALPAESGEPPVETTSPSSEPITPVGTTSTPPPGK